MTKVLRFEKLKKKELEELKQRERKAIDAEVSALEDSGEMEEEKKMTLKDILENFHIEHLNKAERKELHKLDPDWDYVDNQICHIEPDAYKGKIVAVGINSEPRHIKMLSKEKFFDYALSGVFSNMAVNSRDFLDKYEIVYQKNGKSYILVKDPDEADFDEVKVVKKAFGLPVRFTLINSVEATPL